MYDYFADYTKKAAHLAIEYAFPRTASIALISAGAGWYAHKYTLTYFPEKMARNLEDTALQNCPDFIKYGMGDWAEPFCKGTGHYGAPLVVPWTTQEVSSYLDIGVSIATSVTLNLIAEIFFGIKSKKDDKHLLPEALKNVGLEQKIELSAPPKKIQQLTVEDDFLASPAPVKNTPFVINEEEIFGSEPTMKMSCCWKKKN